MEKKQLFLNVQRKQAERVLKRYSEHSELRSDNQFIPVSFKLLDNPKFRNKLMLKKRFRTYLWLRRHVVRGHKFNDPCDIFSNYWMNGELAASMKLEKIAKDLGLSKSTVSDHIRQLENDGIITVDEVSASEAPDGKAHLVFILGTCVNGQEKWLIDDVFNGSKNKLN
jgi:DNA-binding transcriptional ArsR family regulator